VLQFLVSGVAIGAVYGLIGMALAITFYVTRIINFAQGQMMMATVMITAEVSAAGHPTWAAALLGLGCAGVLGVLSYLIAVRPILALNRFSFGWLVSTLGFAVIVQNAAAYIWGPTSQAFPPMLQGTSFHVLDAVVTAGDRNRRGPDGGLRAGPARHAVRQIGMATAADPEMATAVGVNTTVVAIVAFAASALYAGVAGLLIGPTTFANPYLGDTFGTFGFIAMMIGGGTEKPIAAMFGGLLLGVCAEGANAMINSQASDWFPFIVLVVVLIVSPRGLFSAGSLFRARGRPVAPAQV
jgi:branched-chain amino acid transport system permease protein